MRFRQGRYHSLVIFTSFWKSKKTFIQLPCRVREYGKRVGKATHLCLCQVQKIEPVRIKDILPGQDRYTYSRSPNLTDPTPISRAGSYTGQFLVPLC